jgi:hypothetical protein
MPEEPPQKQRDANAYVEGGEAKAVAGNPSVTYRPMKALKNISSKLEDVSFAWRIALLGKQKRALRRNGWDDGSRWAEEEEIDEKIYAVKCWRLTARANRLDVFYEQPVWRSSSEGNTAPKDWTYGEHSGVCVLTPEAFKKLRKDVRKEKSERRADRWSWVGVFATALGGVAALMGALAALVTVFRSDTEHLTTCVLPW